MKDKRLIKIEEALKLPIEGINKQIEVRKHLINQMVGTLYPSILWDEIEKLEDCLEELKNEST